MAGQKVCGFVSSNLYDVRPPAPFNMALQITTSVLVLLGILLALAPRGTAQESLYPRTIGSLAASGYGQSYLNQYSGGAGYHRTYPGYSSDSFSGYNYGYPSNYYTRDASANVGTPGCQSGLTGSSQSTKSSSEVVAAPASVPITDTPKNLADIQLPRANNEQLLASGASLDTSTNGQQQYVLANPMFAKQEGAKSMSSPVHLYSSNYDSSSATMASYQPQGVMTYQNSYNPTPMLFHRSAGVHPLPVLPDSSMSDMRSQSNLQDSSWKQQQFVGRQAYQQAAPITELTYDPRDMVKVYGTNFQPPIFGISMRQPHALQGYQTGYRGVVPVIDTRFLAQQQQQKKFEHPLTSLGSLRENAHQVDHTNQLLPPNVYRSGKWEPVTNLNIEAPVNLADFEPAILTTDGRSVSPIPLCRAKRQSLAESPWMYPRASWSDYEEDAPYHPSLWHQQRAAGSPYMTPYQEPFSSPSPLFPYPPLGALRQSSFVPSYAPAQAKGAVEGIGNLVSGFANLMPMFAGNGNPGF